MNQAADSNDLPDIDLSHGLVLSGRLTANDFSRADSLRPDEHPPQTLPWTLSILFTAGSIAGLVFIQRLDPGVYDQIGKAVPWLFLGFIIGIVPLILKLRRLGASKPPVPWDSPQQWIVQDTALFCLVGEAISQLNWSGLSVRATGDMVVLVAPKQLEYLFPRRFAVDEKAWNDFVRLVCGKLPAAAMRNDLPEPAPDTAPWEGVELRSDWIELLDSPVLAEIDAAPTRIEALHSFDWRTITKWVALWMCIPTLAAGGILAVVKMPDLRYLATGILFASLTTLAFPVALFTIGGRRGETSRGSARFQERCLKFCNVDYSSFYRWNQVECVAVSNDRVVLRLTIHDARFVITRRMIGKEAWNRLYARVSQLPFAA